MRLQPADVLPPGPTDGQVYVAVVLVLVVAAAVAAVIVFAVRASRGTRKPDGPPPVPGEQPPPPGKQPPPRNFPS